VSRRPVTLAVVLASAALLSACGTGQQALTYRELGRLDGASTDVGGRNGVAVRDLHVEPPVTGRLLEQGSTATATGGLVNNGSQPDALLGASSDVAGSATLVVGGETVTSIPLAPMTAAPQNWSIQLAGLTTSVHVATYIDVTLVFERAGRVTVRVPVRAGDNGLSSRTPEQAPEGEHAK
jgi:copper(I)-binding protein